MRITAATVAVIITITITTTIIIIIIVTIITIITVIKDFAGSKSPKAQASHQRFLDSFIAVHKFALFGHRASERIVVKHNVFVVRFARWWAALQVFCCVRVSVRKKERKRGGGRRRKEKEGEGNRGKRASKIDRKEASRETNGSKGREEMVKKKTKKKETKTK